MFEIRHYLTETGHDIFTEWLRKIRDNKAKVAIIRRVNRLELGNFGDHKACRQGVWELRINIGPGYRVYYTQASNTIVLLLCGGNKRTQIVDIVRACEYWHDWKYSNKQENQR
jgi:putative addiction module killer protein